MTLIQSDSTLSIHFRLSLDDDTLVEDSHDDGEPLVFTMGDETLTPGMESLLLGKQVGDTVSGTISPEMGFGYPEEENIQVFNREDFPADIQPEEGQVIAFDGPDEEEIYGTIVAIDDTGIQVDFSHPLAGRTLKFEAEVLDIIQPEDS